MTAVAGADEHGVKIVMDGGRGERGRCRGAYGFW